MVKKKKKRKKRKISKEFIVHENVDWKEKKPFKYFFKSLDFSGLAINSLASLLAILFIISIFLIIPWTWWYNIQNGLTIGSFFNSIFVSLLMFVIIGFSIENFEGLQALAWIIMIILLLSGGYASYQGFKYERCISNFKERPYTFDIKKFIDCNMIDAKDAYGRSEDSVRYQMFKLYSN